MPPTLNLSQQADKLHVRIRSTGPAWSNAPCGDEDAFVTTEMAHSGVNAVRDELANDLVLQLGNKTDGKYEMNFWMYIPAGYGGYYNILHNFAGASSEWGLEFYFNDNGNTDLHAAGADHHCSLQPRTMVRSFQYHRPQQRPGRSTSRRRFGVHTWQWSLDPSTGNPGLNQLSAADFFSGTGVTGITPLYYFDDVEYKTEGTPPTNPRIVVTPLPSARIWNPMPLQPKIMNIANTGNADLDFTDDIYLPGEISEDLNQPQYERIITKAPAQKGAITVDKPGYKMIPDVVNRQHREER